MYIVLIGIVPFGTIIGGVKLPEKKNAHEILDLVRRISMAVKKRMMCGASGMGFTATQFLVMHELVRVDKTAMHELAEKCCMPKSTLSRVVDQLVKRGLVKRTRPEDNRRVVILSVTHSYVKQKEKLKQTVVEELSGRLNPARAVEIKKVLEGLYNMLKTEK